MDDKREFSHAAMLKADDEVELEDDATRYTRRSTHSSPYHANWLVELNLLKLRNSRREEKKTKKNELNRKLQK